MTYTDPAINSGAVVKIGLDVPIEAIRAAIGSLAWVSKSFGRAWEFKEKDLVTEKLLKTPKAYTTGGEYINVLPNDSLFSEGVAASSFIAVRGGEEYELFQANTGSIKKARLSIIIWANLQLIDSSKDYIFTEELKAEIEAKLKTVHQITEIIEWVDERAEEVFKGYDLPNEMLETEYLQYPYAGIRLDVNVTYPEACLS